MASTERTEAMGRVKKLGFQDRFHDHIHCLLYDLVSRRSNTQRTKLSIRLRDVDSPVRINFVTFSAKSFRGFFKSYSGDSVQGLIGNTTNHIPRFGLDGLVG